MIQNVLTGGLLVVALSLASCGNQPSDPAANVSNATTTTQANTENPAAAGVNLEHATVQFEFEENTQTDPPSVKIFISADGKKAEVATATGLANEMGQGELQKKSEAAVAGCTTWWAGGGEVYLVENTGTELIIKMYYVDEMVAEDPSAAKEIKRFKASDLK